MKFKQRIRAEAVFQIFLIIVATFAFSYMIGSLDDELGVVSAAATPGCCSATKDGNYCRDDVAAAECADGKFETGVSCDNSVSCGTGCCIDAEKGSCAQNSLIAQCDALGGLSSGDIGCNLPQCGKGCCVLGGETKFINSAECSYESSQAGFELDYRPEVATELGCIALEGAQTRGACVLGNGSSLGCEILTKQECLGLTGSADSFHNDTLCSAPALNTTCEKQARGGCVDGKDEVYWYDSCGNAENIWSSDEDFSWNGGEILTKAESCSPDSPNINSEACGNCNYLAGSRCTTDGGEAVCGDMNCPDAEGNAKKLQDRQNGESWCVFDSEIGDGHDAVGSRHWKRVCIDGEVQVEPCEDYRNGLCAEKRKNGFSNAVCRPNRAEQCLSGDDNDDCWSKGMDFDEDYEFSVTLPKYPSGFDLRELDKYEEKCGQAFFECTMVEIKTLFSGWECEVGCDCEEPEFGQQMNDWCISLGDCGNYVNFVGKGTNNNVIDGGPDSGWEPHAKYARPEAGQRVKVGDSMKYAKAVLGSRGVSGGTATGGDAEEGEAEEGEEIPHDNEADDYEPDGADWGGALKIAGVGGVALVAAIAGNALGIGVTGATKTVAAGGIKGIAAALTAPGTTPGGDAALYLAEYYGGAAGGADTIIAAETLGAAGGDTLVAEATLGTGTEAVGTSAAAGAANPAMSAIGGAAIGLAIGALMGTLVAEIGGLQGDAVTATVISGAVAGAVAGGIVAYGGAGFLEILGYGGLWGLAIAIVVMVIMKLMGIGDTRETVVTYECKPWTPPSGGGDRKKCNGDPLRPCSEYRCESLGAACGLINIGTGFEMCIWENPGDRRPPIITPNEDVISEGYGFGGISSSGVSIDQNNGECIQENTPVVFGIKTNEASKCKLGTEHTTTFENMSSYFGNSGTYKTEHQAAINSPSKEAVLYSMGVNASNFTDEIAAEINSIFEANIGNHTLFVRCEDVNGNSNEAEFKISYCLKEGPDIEAPLFLASTRPELFLAYGDSTQNITVITDEIVDCRWSYDDAAYDQMTNDMDCDRAPPFSCNSAVDGLDGNDNKIYVRCEDQPWFEGTVNESDRNVNTESFVFTFSKSSTPLTIQSIEPSADFEVATNPTTVILKAVTRGGAEGGKSTCSYELDGAGSTMKTTGGNSHEQVITWARSGTKNLKINCVDIAGNVAENSTRFKITYDSSTPQIARIWQSGGQMYFITNEDAECRYGTSSRDFKWAEASVAGNGKSHDFSVVRGNTYYIKCEDEFGRAPSGFSITARAV